MASKLLRLFFLCAISTTRAQSSANNITLGSILCTNSTPNYWPSSSGHFAFGFYPSGGNGFKVGIWLIGSPKNTIMWTAWRDDPVILPGAAVYLSVDGKLILRNSHGESRSVAETEEMAAFGSMHNTGNFVLYNSSADILWSSFDYPTDTLLVRQKLLSGSYLSSSFDETNHSSGKYRLQVQQDGNLNALPTRSVQEGKYIYWSARTLGGPNVSLILAANIQLTLRNSSGINLKNLTESGYAVTDAYIYRATFDVDGILRLYRHQIDTNGSTNISILWSALDGERRCSVFGICGINSYCTLNFTNVSCHCPPGFDFIDPKQTSKGCRLITTFNTECFQDTTDTKFAVSVLQSIEWESNEYDVISSVSEEDCSQACLKDCNCVVALYHPSQICYSQKLPLRFGARMSNSLMKTLIKINNGSLVPAGPSPKNDVIIKKFSKKILIASGALISFSLVFFVSSGYLIYTQRLWSKKIVSKQAGPSDALKEINLQSFNYDQLVKATDNFRHEVGKGGFGRVYRGNLAEHGGKEIAVKKLEKLLEDGELEFQNEMKIIGKTHHKNLVHLVGFCSEGSNRLLVYEFMKNGSLENHLFNTSERPTWKERTRILIEIARGIHYLHEECETRIIHCDIKPHNILMDESWSAKISDFGLSKLLRPDQTRTYTIPRGTRGYTAPEWHDNSPITVKADVYSFGVMMLNIIFCRKNLDPSLPNDEIILIECVQKCYEENELQKLVGKEEVDIQELETMVKVALLCLQTEPASRPNMRSVILMLEGIVMTPNPPLSPNSY